jgi:hypothetical protein
MDTQQKEKISYIKEYVIAAGYVIFFCLAFALCIIIYYFTYLQPQPSPINAFATGLPPTTPTPHINPTNLQNASLIFKDDFSNDRHAWTDTEDDSQERVSYGTLIFESRKENAYAFANCGSCPYLDAPFYLQADLLPGIATDKGFGIYFNFNSNDNGSFFLFRINTEARKYYVYHVTNDGWTIRAAGESDQIKSFPAGNTLGIYARKDVVEFYINGKIIDSYKQSGYSFHKGDFGFYIDNSGFKLLVDNLEINKIGN